MNEKLYDIIKNQLHEINCMKMAEKGIKDKDALLYGIAGIAVQAYRLGVQDGKKAIKKLPSILTAIRLESKKENGNTKTVQTALYSCFYYTVEIRI